MTRRLLLCACVVLALAAVSCGKTESEKETVVTAIVPVRAGTVTVGDAPVTLSVTGHTETLSRERIIAPLAGLLVTLHGTEGQHVRAGEVVATIRSKEAQSAKEGAAALLAAAKTADERARAQHALELATAGDNGTSVRATSDGVIVSRSATTGEYVAEGQELLQVLPEREIVFVAEVPVTALRDVHVGQSVRLSLPSLGASAAGVSGTIQGLRPQADSSSQTAMIIIRSAALSSSFGRAVSLGMSGTAEILLSSDHQTCLIPRSALVRNEETNSYSVLTFGADSIAHILPVVVGSSVGDRMAVHGDALRAGMTVITEGNYGLPDSTRITLRPLP